MQRQAEEAAARERHFAPTALQSRHETAAASNRQLWASENHGRPAIAATARPGEFKRSRSSSRERGGSTLQCSGPCQGEGDGQRRVPRPANNAARPGNSAAATAEHGAAHAQRASSAERGEQRGSPRVENTSRPASMLLQRTRCTRTPRGQTACERRTQPRPARSTACSAPPHAAAPRAAPGGALGGSTGAPVGGSSERALS